MRFLLLRSENLDLITIFQYIIYRHQLIIYLSTNTF